MYRNLKFTLASLMVLAATVKVNAAKADDAPAMCKNLANYSAQMLNMEFSGGGAYDSTHNPRKITLSSEGSGLDVGKVTDLGNCDDDDAGSKALNQKWCTGFGGGSFEIYKIEMVDSKDKTPEAEVIVNYNSRGACIVREVSLPNQPQ